jgi:hypothetical protein
VQTYAGTAQPFNFNGMVRHYYLRNRTWEGDLLVMLLDKNERERSSHQIAVDARARLKPIADRLGAKIAVVEMPPGPPVLQTNVAEIHGPDARTRHAVAAKMTEFFEAVPIVVDVDNYMADPYDYWRFEVDTQKAVRRGVSVDTINNTLAMAMGGYKLGDIKRGTVLEPTYIVIQVPLSVRSQITRLGDLPVTTTQGGTIPLSELGQFVKQREDPIIYTKDLRAIEYVVGEMEGRLGAPIYGMLAVEDYVKEYTTPDGNSMTTMPMNLFGPPKDDFQSNYEWTGEWTVTYETFRDMGIAFMAALVLIYGLIVWEFKNFALAGLIMSPIPLTMIGIIPGHWIFGAEFTATSMIGMIALGGIIVRQSILIVEFVKLEVAKGLLFGAGVATIMALLVIPLGCISARKQFYVQTSDDGTVSVSPMYERIEQVKAEESAPAAYKTPLWMRLYGGVISAFTWMYYIARAVFTMLGMGFKAILGKFGGGKGTPPPPREPPPASTPPPPAGGTPPPAPPAEPTPTPATDSGAQPEPAAAAAEPAPVASAAEPAPAPAPQASAAEPASAPAPQTSASLDVDEPGDDSAEHEEEEGVSQKRRGIRLKQDLG